MKNKHEETEKYTSKYNTRGEIYITTYTDEFMIGTGLRSKLNPEFGLYKGNQTNGDYMLNEGCVAEIDLDKDTLSYLIVEITERKDDYKSEITGKKYTSRKKLDDIRDMLILFDDKH